MSRRGNLYLGRAGQLTVMAEFLVRGWNVAVPEVDVGDDIFVIRDRDGRLFRIQVKTAAAKSRKYGLSATFAVPAKQLFSPILPELTYVFVIRHEGRWDSFLVVERKKLFEEHRRFNVGSRSSDEKVVFYIAISDEQATCSGRDFSDYLNNWTRWQPIVHEPRVDEPMSTETENV